MTRTEKLRRAVAEAARAAETACTAAWRAHRKMQAVTELAKDLGTTPTIRAFLDAEVARLAEEACAFESLSYDRRGDLNSLAELMGAKER